MELSKEEQKEYYTEVARSLIKDGVTGYKEAELAEDLMNDPDNPFRPLSTEEILQILEKSDKQFQDGNYYTLEEAFEKLRSRR